MATEKYGLRIETEDGQRSTLRFSTLADVQSHLKDAGLKVDDIINPTELLMEKNEVHLVGFNLDDIGKFGHNGKKITFDFKDLRQPVADSGKKGKSKKKADPEPKPEPEKESDTDDLTAEHEAGLHAEAEADCPLCNAEPASGAEDAAPAPEAQPPAAKGKEAPARTKTPPAAKTPAPPRIKEDGTRPPCLCGCGGIPASKKAKFLPGHDAKYHAKNKAPKEPKICKCGCGGQTRGGDWMPGHDAKFHSAQLKAKKAEEKAAAEAKKAAESKDESKPKSKGKGKK